MAAAVGVVGARHRVLCGTCSQQALEAGDFFLATETGDAMAHEWMCDELQVAAAASV